MKSHPIRFAGETATNDPSTTASVAPFSGASLRGEYDLHRAEARRAFELNGDGLRCARARTSFVDALVLRLWAQETALDPRLKTGVAAAAVGGYGRGLLFPYSDVDLLFCVEKSSADRARPAIRRLSQSLWDVGLQLSLSTRTPGECERFEATNAEFGLSLLDLRPVGEEDACGDAALFRKLRDKSVGRLRTKDVKQINLEIARLTRDRHAKYGGTLFHLEPNVKDCPGGLRDANVCEWLHSLSAAASTTPLSQDFCQALAFLAAVRCFLHYRHERDDNTLDWLAQDAAAAQGIGMGRAKFETAMPEGAKADAALWMRAYFRHARIVERTLAGKAEAAGLLLNETPPSRRVKLPASAGFVLSSGSLALDAPSRVKPSLQDPANDPGVVLALFAAMAVTGSRLSPASEERIADAIPQLSANLEEGPGLWRSLSAILTAPWAGTALRSMHALGVLELILPEFHGIDALVIRDAYHRYTVDEHTFVLVDTLHGLQVDPGPKAPDWRVKFGSMVRELQNPGLLYLAALLHDTGKGRAGDHHALESARMARSVLERLEMDAYETGLVMRLIETHLEMSAALRRDIFDVETVRTFAAKVQTQEALRMLTLFTYADIAAVHPDALTPWKAENLWRLSMATANHLDRNVDEDRVHTGESLELLNSRKSAQHDRVARVLSLAVGQELEAARFLQGFPERYVSTRSPESMLQHFEMTRHFAEEPLQIAFLHGMAVSEIALITFDRPQLFAGMSAALAAWGMNVITAEAFANSAGVVVDTFRFTDTFRTLELNASEQERFVTSIRDLLSGQTSVEKLLSGRRRARRVAPRLVVETRVEFDAAASSHSTLLQVIAQDLPGLLRAISATVSERGFNIEVALIDTEGEMAIDVFYLTSAGARLTEGQEASLRAALIEAIATNAS